MAQRCIRCMHMSEEELCPVCGWPGSGENSNHQLPVGTVLRDRYQIGKVLGQGGFGITYLAWDLLMDKQVAVKEFFPGGTVFRRSNISTAVECITEEAVPHYDYSKERFLREARALVQFKDVPEVVDILDFISENNTSYIVMEYVRGVDLAKYIQMKGGKLSPEETFRILKPVMEALAKVHKGGIVHRDISPDNIILDPMGGAKLLDFGAVRAVEDPDVDKGLSKSTEAILKQGFAPLEQYNSRGSLGPWTDEYAMCATVWYCLTGTVPVEASIRMTEGIDPDWSTVPGLPGHQQLALAKGFSCRAKDRYRSLDELLDALFSDPGTQLPVTRKIPAAQPPVRKAEKKKTSRNAVWIGLVAILAVIAAAVTLLLPKAPQAAPMGPAAVESIPGTTGPLKIEEPPTLPPTTEPEPTETTADPDALAYQEAEALLAEGKLGEAAIAFGKLAGYSDARERSLAIWEKIAVRDTISTIHFHTVGLRVDGTVIATGLNENGQCDLSNWSNINAIAAGGSHTLGLKTDGTVIAAGSAENGRCAVDGWTDIVSICAGLDHSVGLKIDGTVVATGNNNLQQCDVEGWTDIVAIIAGGEHTVGLKADGTVVATGNNEDGQCVVEQWTDIIAVSAGRYHTVGLKADGTAVAVGMNDVGPNYSKGGRTDVGEWTGLKAVSGGGWFTVGLTEEGNILLKGDLRDGRTDANYWLNIVDISAGDHHIVGLRPDGKVWAAGWNYCGCCNVSIWKDILVREKPVPFR